MRHVPAGWRFAVMLAAILQAACGGGASTGGSPSPANATPVANAGPAQAVNGGDTVMLNGTASTDPDGSIASFAWTQAAGATVSLINASTAQPTFVAPVSATAATFTFSLSVTDNRGAAASASVTITVNPPNALPFANPGPERAVASGSLVTLDGSASFDPDGSIVSHAWTQVSGIPVSLANANSVQAVFTAPQVTVATTLTFRLVVTDNRGAVSPGTSLSVRVDPPLVNIAGTLRFTRIPFVGAGLAYSQPVLQPARGVVVRVLESASRAVLAEVVSSATGAYSMNVPAGTLVFIQAVARTRNDAVKLPALAALNWNVRVQDGTSATAEPYVYNSAVFDTSSPLLQVDIPSGLSSAGTRTGERYSGPFAILDSIFTAIQLVASVAPDTSFPALYVDWGSQNSGTFFTSTNGAHIALMADLTEDTDEFDQHVVTHEFGHFVERAFSRSDSLGGSHALGNRLDPRVAFSEGWATAFGAIALNDPFYRDSFFRNGLPGGGGWVIENNPTTPATAPDSTGCWCSESSVAAILWDIHDSVSDANDSVGLGFAPLWSALTGGQRTTPAVTSIFSFIQALNALRPAEAIAINQVVGAQNIDVPLASAFATSETHTPIAGTLPLFTDINLGIPVVVRSFDDAGHYNRLGNRRLLRFTPTTTGNVTISLATSNPDPAADPDFRVLQSGTVVASGTSPPPQPESRTVAVTAGTTYIIDAYDCANGCSTVQGTAGDHDLTVTIN